jgi:hypothetical protein
VHYVEHGASDLGGFYFLVLSETIGEVLEVHTRVSRIPQKVEESSRRFSSFDDSS